MIVCMRRGIMDAEVCLGFRDDAGNTLAPEIGGECDAEQVARELDGERTQPARGFEFFADGFLPSAFGFAAFAVFAAFAPLAAAFFTVRGVAGGLPAAALSVAARFARGAGATAGVSAGAAGTGFCPFDDGAGGADASGDGASRLITPTMGTSTSRDPGRAPERKRSACGARGAAGADGAASPDASAVSCGVARLCIARSVLCGDTSNWSSATMRTSATSASFA